MISNGSRTLRLILAAVLAPLISFFILNEIATFYPVAIQRVSTLSMWLLSLGGFFVALIFSFFLPSTRMRTKIAVSVASALGFITTTYLISHIDPGQPEYVLIYIITFIFLAVSFDDWNKAAATGVAIAILALNQPPLELVATATSFVVAAASAVLIVNRLISSSHSLVHDLIGVLIWIALSHAVWITILFTFSSTELIPRALFIAVLTSTVIVAVIVPLIIVLVRDGLQALMPAEVDPKPETEPLFLPGDEPPLPKQLVAWIISLTPVATEPRVLRQASLLKSKGWHVVVCGFEGRENPPTSWDYVRLPQRDKWPGIYYLIANMLRRCTDLVLRHYPKLGHPIFLALIAHSTNLYWLYLRIKIRQIAFQHPELKADLVIGHDYHAADIAHDVCRIFDSALSLDIHEYAKEQYANDPAWIQREQPVVVGVQRHYLAKADVVTIVCEGIGKLVAEDNFTKSAPVTIRNLPFYSSHMPSPVINKIKVLYHGDISRSRYLHTAIESVPGWRDEFVFIIRGSGDPSYIAELKRLAKTLSVEDRIIFEPPVEFAKIVEKANEADIGFFSYEIYSPQIKYALPNKLFEYIMAGLAICTIDLDEVGRIVRKYDLGTLIPHHTPEDIAITINSFDRQSIMKYKNSSLSAAKQLNWEQESEALYAAYLSALNTRLKAHRGS